MRRFAMFLIVALVGLPGLAARRVTVEQLEQFVAAQKTKADADLAWQLADLELTERLSTGRADRLKASLPGDKSRKAFVALVDLSAVLDPPASEIPVDPAPTVAEQRRIMGLVVAYVGKTIPQLPNFLATRVTQRFEDTPQVQRPEGLLPYQPLHPLDEARVTVQYRDGREVVEADDANRGKAPAASQGLQAWGIFGPILSTVLVDAAKSKLVWGHWEKGPNGLEAVFTYEVPKEKSHYEVNYCCVAEQAGSASANVHPFRQFVGYQGEMAVDPATGTILRLAVVAAMKPTDPVVKATMLVEYGPVEIGGKTYNCPLRSVSSSLAQTLQTNLKYAFPLANQMQPLKSSVSDMAFTQYHVFRSEAKVLAGGETPESARLSSAAPATTETSGNADATTAEAVAPPAAAAEAELAETKAEPPAQPAEVAVPEMMVTAATGLPDVPAKTQPAVANPGFTLRTTTRLVDLAVVAFDKKGHPITDLKPSDLEVFDDGRKQEIRSFGQASTAEPNEAGTAATSAMTADGEPVFTNRPNTAKQTASKKAETNRTILLIDSGNLAWGDWTNARSEMQRFLKSAPSDEPIGLYVLGSYGYKVLREPTVDHAAIADALVKYMPTAQDVSNAQAAERLNRQQIDEVHSKEDLTRVNGHTNIDDPAGDEEVLDPELRDYGKTPGQDAMVQMLRVARHLAEMPVHKSLVWVTSDNVLADWSNTAVSIERSSRFIEPFVLHAQEAMNDAHVSVYPLDCSQLEGGAIDANMQHRNVELTQATKDKLALEHGPQVIQAPSGEDVSTGRDMGPGRITAAMQQDLHSIQGPIREFAEATGGRALRRAGDIAGEMNGIVADGRAAYLLSFSPDQPADDKYHLITVQVMNRKNVTLRYRTGYLYAKEPGTLKERFQQAVWQPKDAAEIGVSAMPLQVQDGRALKLRITTADLDLAQVGNLLTDRLDIFLVERNDDGEHAKVTGQTLGLRLKPETYQKALHDGVLFDLQLPSKLQGGSLRVVVVDENTGRMGSVTLPGAALERAPQVGRTL